MLPLRLEGVRFNGGPALGVAVLHQPKIIVRHLIAEDISHELERLRDAVEGMHDALDTMLADKALSETGEHREILESYRMIAEDRGWLGRIIEAIESGLTAEAAVQKIQDETSARMAQITDSYLRERAADFEDLADRLLQHLAGHQNGGMDALPTDLSDMVVVAKSMGPGQLLDYDRDRLRALLLEDGSPTSHVAIVARALDIPVVGRVRGLLDRIEPFDPVIVDGDNGQVFIRPGDDVQQVFTRSVRAISRRKAAYAALRDEPAKTRDGFVFSLNLNAGLLVDITSMHETGADGVGLYRTEIPFMVRPDFPGVQAQAELYTRILDQAEGKPVVFRTLDIGGDKVLPYFSEPVDENPAMGWRAIRIALDRPAILRQQLRALIQASAGRGLAVMFPMITEVAEFDSARAVLDIELQRAKSRGQKMPKTVQVGAMIEVPALTWQLPALFQRVDFLSVGSNDLVQFMFATDRGNPRMAERYDVLSPSVLTLLRSIADQCTAAGVPVTVCGEMAGQPLEAMALAGIGYRSLSMVAPSVGPVKDMIRSLELRRLADYLRTQCGSADHSLRGKLKSFAKDHGIAF
ncbi:MAG: phosphoenolpyruvate--protein phosphotransferase [Pseudomonadota bacterium]